MSKRALITGVTGQDGSYLAEFLLTQGYDRHRDGPADEHRQLRADRSYPRPARAGRRDLLDEVSLITILRDHRPDEVYNLAAQSFVQTASASRC